VYPAAPDADGQEVDPWMLDERVKSLFRQWLLDTTPAPWGVAHDRETGTYTIVARDAEGRPRMDQRGVQIVIAEGMTRSDAAMIVQLRTLLEDDEAPRKVVSLF
jgi:hypothetical protein